MRRGQARGQLIDNIEPVATRPLQTLALRQMIQVSVGTRNETAVDYCKYRYPV